MDGYAPKSVVDEDAMLDRERYSPSPCGTDVAPAIVVGTKEVRIAKGIHAAIDLFSCLSSSSACQHQPDLLQMEMVLQKLIVHAVR